KLARRLFHSMLLYGPKLEREQILLGRFVDAGTELFAIAASCSRAQHMIDTGCERGEVLQLVDHFCRESRRRVEGYLRGVRGNSDRLGYGMAQEILEGKAAWLTREIVGEPDAGSGTPDRPREGRE